MGAGVKGEPAAPAGLAPARIAFGADGAQAPQAPDYGDIYHSQAGALGQAQHVFLGGNGLPQAWRGRECFVVLETGFGLGSNFLATWRAWHEDPQGARRLHYISVEKHPVATPDLQRAHGMLEGVETFAAQLRAQLPPPLAGFHRLAFEGGRLQLTLLYGDAASLLADLDAEVDATYLDGFAPARNPDMWSAPVFEQLARLARPGGTLATWSISAEVRHGLAQAGFDCTRVRGFATKRDMLVGRRRGEVIAPTMQDKRALVIGAGLAGCGIADALGTRGWAVTLLERHAAPAREASGNPAGALRPILNRSDAMNAKLSRAALLHAWRVLHTLGPDGPHWWQSGVLHVATEPGERDKLHALLQGLAMPEAFARAVDATEAAAIAGQPVRDGGVWFPGCGWADPARVCTALLGRSGADARFGAEVAALRRDGSGEWIASDASGHELACAPVVVLAGANDTVRLATSQGIDLRLEAVRGQVTQLPSRAGRALAVTVCGDGYIAPAPDGGCCAGASFQRGDRDGEPRVADHVANLARIAAMLPGYTDGLDAASLQGRVAWRATTPDRLPLLGGFAAAPGLHGFTGLGARGLVWTPLLAEWLACTLNGEPRPFGRKMAQVTDINRVF